MQIALPYLHTPIGPFISHHPDFTILDPEGPLPIKRGLILSLPGP